MVRAIVREWHEDEGWGVFDSLETPGGCWAHFTTIESPVIERGDGYEVTEYKDVRAGDAVELEWEQPGQDGFGYRAVSVRTPDSSTTGEDQTVGASAVPSIPDGAHLVASSTWSFDEDENPDEFRCMFCEGQASAFIQATRHMSRSGICSECLMLFRANDLDGLIERRRAEFVEEPAETIRVVRGLLSTWVEVI